MSLRLAHDDSFKSVFISSLAVWTGYWIGTSLNAKLLKFFFGDECKKLFAHCTILSCVDKAAEEHGLKVIIFLRLSPFYGFNIFS